MEAEEPRRPLVRRQNPELTIGDARAATQEALLERLAALPTGDEISELRMISDLMLSRTTELTKVSDLEPAAMAALSGLVLSLSKGSNRLDSAQVHGIH